MVPKRVCFFSMSLKKRHFNLGTTQSHVKGDVSEVWTHILTQEKPECHLASAQSDQSLRYPHEETLDT